MRAVAVIVTFNRSAVLARTPQAAQSRSWRACGTGCAAAWGALGSLAPSRRPALETPQARRVGAPDQTVLSGLLSTGRRAAGRPLPPCPAATTDAPGATR